MTWNIHFIWWQYGLKQRGFNSTACHRFAIYSGYLDGIELCVLADQCLEFKMAGATGCVDFRVA
jgi:hypothetical protein